MHIYIYIYMKSVQYLFIYLPDHTKRVECDTRPILSKRCLTGSIQRFPFKVKESNLSYWMENSWIHSFP